MRKKLLLRKAAAAVAVHAAIIAINDAVDHSVAATTLSCLLNPAAHVSNIIHELSEDYQSTLYDAKQIKKEIAFNKVIIIIIIFKAHHHKAAGRKTRLDIQNYGCNSYLIYYHSVIIIIINEYYYSAMESKKTSRSLNNRKNKTSDSVMRDKNRSKACQRSNEQLKSSVFSRRLKAMTRCAME